MPIEQIKVGDKVLSYDEKTKTYEYKTVAQTFTAVKENIVKIKIRGEKLLTTTTEHPFYVKKSYKARDSLPNGDDEEGEWLTASELKVGDKVLRPDGLWTRITSIKYSTELTIVYNLEVEGNHNYLVGEVGVLSHNCNIGKWAFGFERNAIKLADEVGGNHLMNTSGWKAKVLEIFGNSKNEIHFSLDGFDQSVYQAILSPNRSSTNWELHTLYNTYREAFEKTVFHYQGKTYVGYDVFKIQF